MTSVQQFFFYTSLFWITLLPREKAFVAPPSERDHRPAINGEIFYFKVNPGNGKGNLDDVIFERFEEALMQYHKSDESIEITEHSFVRNDFFSLGNCERGLILELRMSGARDENTIQWFLLSETSPNQFSVYRPVIEPITERKKYTSAEPELSFSLNGRCPVFAIRSGSEGGNKIYEVTERIIFYSLHDGFNEILQLQIENTAKEVHYYGNPDSVKVIHEKRTLFEIVKSDKIVPYDIKVVEQEGTSNQRRGVYHWDGKVYQLKGR
jgi:hypothetical protein